MAARTERLRDPVVAVGGGGRAVFLRGWTATLVLTLALAVPAPVSAHAPLAHKALGTKGLGAKGPGAKGLPAEGASRALAPGAEEASGVALITVALRGGGRRKCAGAVLGPKEVLAHAQCLQGSDDSKLVQVQTAAAHRDAGARPWRPPKAKGKGKDGLQRKKARGNGLEEKKRAAGELHTRFARRVDRSEEGLVLLHLTAALGGGAQGPKAAEVALPVGQEQPPFAGSAPCRLYAWGAGEDPAAEWQLAQVAARAGNWSGCWQRAGVGPVGAGAGAGAGTGAALCALGAGCLPAGVGAVLLCGAQGAVAGMAAPAPFARVGDGPRCATPALALRSPAPLLPWLRQRAPQVMAAASGLPSEGGGGAGGGGGASAPPASPSPRRPRPRRSRRHHGPHHFRHH